MPLSYPLQLSDWFDLLPIGSYSLRRSEGLYSSRTAGGEVIVDRTAEPLWVAEVGLGRLTPAEASSAEALFSAAQGPGRAVFVTPYYNQFPQDDPTGAVLGSSTPTLHTIDRGASTVTIAGLPSGYTLRRGDFLSINFGNANLQTSLHQCAEDSAEITGGIRVHVEPNPAISILVGDEVQLARPRFKGIVEPGSYRPGQRSSGLSEGASLRIVQTLGAL